MRNTMHLGSPRKSEEIVAVEASGIQYSVLSHAKFKKSKVTELNTGFEITGYVLIVPTSFVDHHDLALHTLVTLSVG